MSRSNISKVRLNLSKMERTRAKKAHHIENLYKQVVYLDQLISVYKEALAEEATGAVHNSGSEGQSGSGEPNLNTGEPNVFASADNQTVLDQQSPELRNDSPDTGELAGC